MNFVITHGLGAFNRMQADVRKGNPVSCLIAATCGVGVVGKISYDVYRWYRLRNLRHLKRQQCADSKQKLREHISANDYLPLDWNDIVSLSTEDLSKKLQNKELKAVDVLRSYQKKTLDIDEEINCAVEPIWEAEALALECDMAAKKGPLHGMPVSVKENNPIRGYNVSLGLSENLESICAEDCVLIKVLKKQGAVPYIRTNVPQGLLSFQCSNPIYGATLHPHDRSRSPGGSSGGEGALIGSGGSILGMGSDIGGSIRIPSHMCGVCGFKPTVGRLSMRGLHHSSFSRPSIFASYGPMARDVNGVVLLMQSLLCPYMFELDPQTPAVPFREDIFKSKDTLRIGFYVNDGFLQAAPACERAVEVARGILQRQGHTLVPWCPPDVELAISLFIKQITGDGGHSVISDLLYDKKDEAIAPVYYILRTPKMLRKIASIILRPFSKQLSLLLSAGAELTTISEYWAFHKQLLLYRDRVIGHWQNNRLDAVICPGFSTPAQPNNKRALVNMVNYTALHNVLDFPAGSLPVTRITAEDDSKLDAYPARDIVEKLVKKLSADAESLTVNVQCVTLPWQEELCLRVMKEIENGLKEDLTSSV